MISDAALGNAIADVPAQHAAELNLYYIICAPDLDVGARRRGLAGDGDRGSATANHYDHVHVTTNG